METRIISLGFVNGYLLKAAAGFVLVDVGPSSQRAILEKNLGHAGCQPGNLNLVVATHGDSDHVGNRVYLRQKYATKIAMHNAEVEAVKKGDPTLNKKIPRTLLGALIKSIVRLFVLKPTERFEPEVLLVEGKNLSGYGLNAQVLHIPGHSNGSFGILTPNGELFCGDLLSNFLHPTQGMGIFDTVEFETTLEKLKRLKIRTVYPGHGAPFDWKQFMTKRSKKK